MKLLERNSLGRKTAVVVATVGSFVLLTAGVAYSDHVDPATPSAATAQAAELTLLIVPLVDTGLVTATNDGTQPEPGTVTGNPTPGLALLGAQTLLSAGALAQNAAAGHGTSAACAGAVGLGGAIQIGAAGPCVATIGTPDGVTVIPGPLLPLISADAIYAECTATTGPPQATTGSATLVNADIGGTPIPANPGPNTVVAAGALLELVVNEQTSAGPGQISVTALHLTVLDVLGGAPLAELRIGEVTCFAPPVISAFPIEGLPIALAGFSVAGGAAYLVYRRRHGAVALAA